MLLAFLEVLGHKLVLDGMQKKNPHAVALGKMGGAKGGKKRAANLTPEQRSASARRAALARWAGRRKEREKDLPNPIRS